MHSDAQLRSGPNAVDRRDSWWGRGLTLFLVLLVVALIVVPLLVPSENNPATGTWFGYDSAHQQVVYYLGPDGRGWRETGEKREQLRFDLKKGYPNLIRLTVGSGKDTTVFQGIARITSERLSLELAPPNRPAPQQLTPRALELRRPAPR